MFLKPYPNPVENFDEENIFSPKYNLLQLFLPVCLYVCRPYICSMRNIYARSVTRISAGNNQVQFLQLVTNYIEKSTFYKSFPLSPFTQC